MLKDILESDFFFFFSVINTVASLVILCVINTFGMGYKTVCLCYIIEYMTLIVSWLPYVLVIFVHQICGPHFTLVMKVIYYFKKKSFLFVHILIIYNNIFYIVKKVLCYPYTH